MEELRKMSAADLGRGIGRGDIDPRALTEAFLSAIDRHPARDAIYARVTPDRARAEADAAAVRAQSGARRSPLDGVPISWKDLFDTAGIVTESGSALLRDRRPTRDARVLERATEAGLVCLGKTHLSELAFSGLGLNPITATPPNAFDETRAPGGSSSGAAVSTALDLAAAGIGSDTGGSVRIPAAWNDLVGLKTTHGRLPLTGVVPLCADFDTVGPLCRSVEDAALLLAAMEGGKAPDLTGSTLAGRRFLVLENVALEDIQPEPLAAFENAVARLADSGAEIVRGEVPAISEAMPLSGALFTAEAYAEWGETIEASPDKMFPRILERFRSGREVSAVTYVRSVRKMLALRTEWANSVSGFDAVLAPTAPILPPDTARLLDDNTYYDQKNLLALRNTRIGNLMGLCALTIPTGIRYCGLMLLGSANHEERLLRIGQAAEEAVRSGP